MHLAPPGVQWRTPALDAALASAQAVWFEVPLDAASQARAAAAARAHADLPPGVRLSGLLSTTGRERLARVGAGLGAWPMLDRLQPWMADVTPSALQIERRGGRRDLGVEARVDASAPAAVQRRSFETTTEQVALFVDAPRTEQVASLEETLREIDADPSAYDRLAAAWARGDADAIEREAVAPLRLRTPAVYARLVVARNRRWTAEILRQLQAGRRIVIVVGVGHLVGCDSVVALLRRAGARVEGP